jgi:hypothetical protein
LTPWLLIVWVQKNIGYMPVAVLASGNEKQHSKQGFIPAFPSAPSTSWHYLKINQPWDPFCSFFKIWQ